MSAFQSFEPAADRWIRAGHLRRLALIAISVVGLTVVEWTGAVIHPAVFILLGLWALVAGGILPHRGNRLATHKERLSAYSLTLLVDALFLAPIMVLLDAPMWAGAVWFVNTINVGSAVLRWRAVRALAFVMATLWVATVLWGVLGFGAGASPFGLPSIRGNWPYFWASAICGVLIIFATAFLMRRVVDTIASAEERYLRLVQEADDAIVVIDHEGRVVDANPAAVELAGYGTLPLIGRLFDELVPEEDAGKLRAEFAAVVRNGQTVRALRRIKRGTGERRWVSVTITPMDRGGDSQLLLVVRDVTEEHRQGEALRESEERFRLLVSSLDEQFFLMDGDLRFTAVYGRWLERAGLAEDALVGKTIFEAFPDDIAAMHAENLRHGLEGRTRTYRWSMSIADGQPPRHFRTTVGPLRRGGSSPSGVAGSTAEITRSVLEAQEREALRQRIDRAEKAEALGRLVSGVAHELNNPLAAILNFSEMLLADARSPEDRDALEIIEAQALRSRTIVRDLLSYVRQGEARSRARQAPRALLESVVRSLEPAFRPAQVQLSLDLRDGDTPLEIDRPGIEQVVTNLVTNAAQVTPPGGTVRVFAWRDGAQFMIRVDDDGPGIPADAMPRLFEPFYSTKPTGRGVGLGLSVSLGIVQQHLGSLVASNRPAPAHGASFLVTLPVATAPVDAPPVPALPAAAAPLADKPRLMVVDDELAIRRALRRFFEGRGWQVDEAADGAAALQHLVTDGAADRYDALVCDLKMPGVSGIDVHDQLALHAPALLDRLLIATGDVTAPDVSDFVARTRCRVLEKPFELSELERITTGFLAVPRGGEVPPSAVDIP